jgi:hypothetical protein
MMKDINDSIKSILDKNLNNILPRDVGISWKQNPEYRVTLSSFLKTNHPLIKLLDVDNQLFFQISYWKWKT